MTNILIDTSEEADTRIIRRAERPITFEEFLDLNVHKSILWRIVHPGQRRYNDSAGNAALTNRSFCCDPAGSPGTRRSPRLSER